MKNQFEIHNMNCDNEILLSLNHITISTNFTGRQISKFPSKRIENNMMNEQKNPLYAVIEVIDNQ